MAQTTLDQRMLGVGTALTDHTITASDVITFADVGDSNLTKKDTLQGVLDLAGGGGYAYVSTQTASGSSDLSFTNMASGVVFDATCGVGSMSIAAALNPRVSKVIAVDTDASRLDMAKHNAKIYGVLDRLEFIHGDSNEIISDHSPNLVIADPPWGGRDWNREHTDLNSLGMSLEALLDARCGVIIKLPLSFDLASLPGNWAPTAMIDSRGIIKFIKVTRVGTHS